LTGLLFKLSQVPQKRTSGENWSKEQCGSPGEMEDVIILLIMFVYVFVVRNIQWTSSIFHLLLSA